MQKKQFEIGNEAFVISKLDEGETVKAFDCGDDDLNDPTRLLYYDLNDVSD
jgi:hypothetical protein